MDSSSEGVVVTTIDSDGQAARQGLKVGDVILDVEVKWCRPPLTCRTRCTMLTPMANEQC
jgi:hypothetical protein